MRQRSTKICAGSACRGRSRCGGRASILPIIAAAISRSSKRRACSIRVSKAAASSARLSRCSTARVAGRAIRTACRSILGGRGKYPPPSAQRRQEAGEPFALRLAMDRRWRAPACLTLSETGSGPQGRTGRITAAPQLWGDVVLARKELPTSYHLAVVIDDALQGVTDVVRGQDLFWATAIHRLLQALLGLPEPTYHHHELVLDAKDDKLSKSTQATGLRELRAAGMSAAISGAWWGWGGNPPAHRYLDKMALHLEHDPEKPALGLDPWVDFRFSEKIMLQLDI